LLDRAAIVTHAVRTDAAREAVPIDRASIFRSAVVERTRREQR
jgi:hypothetical protein